MNTLRRWSAGIALAAVTLTLLTGCTRDVTVTHSDLAAEYTWPFKTDSVTLHCLDNGAITVDVDGTTYAVWAEYGDLPSTTPMLPGMEQIDPKTGILATPFLTLAQDRCKAS